MAAIRHSGANHTIGVEFSGFAEVIKRLQSLDKDVKAITEDALKQAAAAVTKKAEAAMEKGNLPAHGRYSTGKTLSGLLRDPRVIWRGTEAEIPVGFDSEKSGLAWIYLIRGNPAHQKDQALYDAFYSSETEGEVRAIEKRVFYAGIEEAKK